MEIVARAQKWVKSKSSSEKMNKLISPLRDKKRGPLFFGLQSFTEKRLIFGKGS